MFIYFLIILSLIPTLVLSEIYEFYHFMWDLDSKCKTNNASYGDG